jgi:hypothetical protein
MQGLWINPASPVSISHKRNVVLAQEGLEKRTLNPPQADPTSNFE